MKRLAVVAASLLLLGVALVVAGRWAGLVSVTVYGDSMSPTFSDGGTALGIRLGSDGVADLQRFEVVGFQPRIRSRSYIGRVIALPGEVVTLDGERVLVGGRALSEPHVLRKRRSSTLMKPFPIPADSYLILGDNRDGELSGLYGIVQASDVSMKIRRLPW